ncbi:MULTISPECIES: HPP family protein [unclassified Caballeronia]|uniref:HPP family protein n=1 Tax=unclassified Caballeronia TaxID=2646786 RepID=UPI002854CA19|nr:MULTISPECIES: HPP family protein [unclassified Caballeronia]MDR5739450.1 HPP family protein [Caballeronia sp. LZ016]MDR5807939.1 HPP family protein [Caballeronia sp. LZ019]
MSRPALLRWLHGFLPAPVTLRWTERLRAGVGALIGIALTGGIAHLLVGDASAIPFLIAPMGASAVLLFAVPASPLAQPWSIIGGNLVSAIVGVTCAALIHDPVDAAALAIALAICAMFALRCVHPPSGAVALTAVLGGPSIHALGYGFVLAPVAIQSFALLGSAIVFHALTGHRYPHVAQVAPKTPDAASFLRADLEAVLARRSEMLDIDPDDLEALLRETQLQAYARRFTEFACADIMSRGVVAVSPETTAQEALSLLLKHRVKALPVIDATRRVIGIVTRADIAPALRATPRSGFARAVERIMRDASATPPRIAALMTTDVCTVDARTAIAELVPMFADFGHHHIPVVDGHERLVGMITETDLISGLYRQSFAGERKSA